MEISESVFIAGAFTLAGWVLWLVFRKFQYDRELRFRELDVQREMVRKFDSAEAMMEFLRSEEGRRCFPGESETHPMAKLHRSTALGLTLMLFGIVMAVQGYSWRNYEDINFVNKMHDYYYWAGLMTAAGMGLMVHAWLGRRQQRSVRD